MTAGLAALTLVGSSATPLRAAEFNPSIGWREGGPGLAEAARIFRPVFMVVHADWCPACKTYAQLFSDRRVIDTLGGFVPVLVNADRDRIASRYQPDGAYIPRSMVLSSQGEHFDEVTGPYEHRWFLPPQDADYLVDYLERGLTRAGGGMVEMGSPVRKSVPSGEDAPSFGKPAEARTSRGAAPSGDGGPKRMRVPGTASSDGPVRKTVPGAQAPTPADPAAGGQPGLIERLFGKVL